ncbi:RNA polymerase sigma factor [Streptomyces sp. NPDC086989]|uniref:RNA polymerase sigma factor n=1 Tax=Streptomyces sp. NPDC086989 TaxID=3365764 RepID=UPI003823BB05
MRNRTTHPPPPGQELPLRSAPQSIAHAAADQDAADDLDDGLLAVRASEGDEEAFAILVRRHNGRLLALARHLLGNRADAEDAVQDAFISAWRQLPEFRRSAAFSTWMYRIVTNRCLNVLRRQTHGVPLDAIAEPPTADAGSSPPRTAETDAATAALLQALMDLRPDLRACWVMRELHGLHYDEIAHVLGSSEQTVRGRLARARRALMEAMRPWR